MRKKLAGLAALMALAGMGLVVYLMATGPRMRVQPIVKTYQAAMPLPPAGSVPVDSPPALPSADEAVAMRNPLPDTAANRARGEVYYRYYCTFCHGDRGDGRGPVGESYVPAPTDLRSAKVRGYSDGQLLRAMLLGIGHEPVLARTVLPEHRWYLVLYVRQLP